MTSESHRLVSNMIKTKVCKYIMYVCILTHIHIQYICTVYIPFVSICFFCFHDNPLSIPVPHRPLVCLSIYTPVPCVSVLICWSLSFFTQFCKTVAFLFPLLNYDHRLPGLIHVSYFGLYWFVCLLNKYCLQIDPCLSSSLINLNNIEKVYI